VAVAARWEVDPVLGQEDRQRIAAHLVAVLEDRVQPEHHDLVTVEAAPLTRCARDPIF
jgi:hypothetical protein